MWSDHQSNRIESLRLSLTARDFDDWSVVVDSRGVWRERDHICDWSGVFPGKRPDAAQSTLQCVIDRRMFWAKALNYMLNRRLVLFDTIYVTQSNNKKKKTFEYALATIINIYFVLIEQCKMIGNNFYTPSDTQCGLRGDPNLIVPWIISYWSAVKLTACRTIKSYAHCLKCRLTPFILSLSQPVS